MRAITLHQPWASLIAAWIKWCETRSWPAPQSLWGTRIAIHAALRPVSKTAAVAALITRGGFDEPLPLGVVVATARLVDCGQIIDDAGDGGRVLRLTGGDNNEDVLVHDDGMGDYSIGRWVWRLADVVPLEIPVPALGRQRIWIWTPPEGVVLPGDVCDRHGVWRSDLPPDNDGLCPACDRQSPLAA